MCELFYNPVIVPVSVERRLRAAGGECSFYRVRLKLLAPGTEWYRINKIAARRRRRKKKENVKVMYEIEKNESSLSLSLHSSLTLKQIMRRRLRCGELDEYFSSYEKLLCCVWDVEWSVEGRERASV